jgi:LemA protein
VNLVLVGAAVVLVAAAAVMFSYNRFVVQRQLIWNAWANVDTELQRRHELIPNLVETVRGYAAHERTTLTEVVAARLQAMTSERDAAHRANSENALTRGLQRLLALSEAYPDLLASAHFRELQDELITTENRIQAARRIYNGNVRDYNRRVQAVPSLIVAKLFGFSPGTYVELEPLVRDAGAPIVNLA